MGCARKQAARLRTAASWAKAETAGESDEEGQQEMSAGVSENFSESKTGRPTVISDTEAATYRALGLLDGTHSRRSLLNVHYRQRALSLLVDFDSFQWLIDGDKMRRGEANAWRQTILTELGRIADEETMRAVALQLCALKPKTKDAVLMVRSFRKGGKPKADALQLANEIIGKVNDYLQRHSDASEELILDAFNTAIVQIKGARL